VAIPREVTVANAAKGAAESALSTEFAAIRRPAVRQLEDAWNAGAPAYIGPGNNRIKSTPYNWLQRPDFYAPASPELNAARQAWDAASDQILRKAQSEFGVKIEAWTPETPGASYAPNVMSREAMDKAADGIASSYTSAGLSTKTGPAKTRLWEDAYTRMSHDPRFVPETDLATLMSQHDQALSRMAGNETFRLAAGGKNRLEVMQEIHPALAEKMTGLRDRLAAIRSSLSSVNSRASAAVDKFLANPDSMTLGDLANELDVKITRGPRAGMTARDLQKELAAVRSEIRRLRPAWDGANLDPYKFSRQTYMYHQPDVSKAIDDVLRTKLNMGQSFLDTIDEVRQTAFAGDFSPMVGVQAPLGFLSDPVTGARAIPGIVRELRDPGSAIAREIAENPASVATYTEASGRSFGELGSEFHRTGKGLERLPVLGVGVKEANRRMMSALGWMQYRMWKADRTILKALNPEMTDAVAAHEAWNNVSKVIPALNPAERAASVLQAQLERAPLVSTSFIGGPLSLVKDATSGIAKLIVSAKLSPAARWQGLAGREQLALLRGATLVGSTSALGIASYVAAGKSLKDATETVLNPNTSRFMSIAIPGTDLYIPIGGPFRSMARMMAPRKVGEVNGVAVYLPFAGAPNFARGKLGPLTRLPIDLLRNKDYYGRQIASGDFPENMLRTVWYAAESLMPLTAGAVSKGIRTGESIGQIAREAGGQLAGTNIYETSPYQQMVEQFRERTGRDYNPESAADRALVQGDEGLAALSAASRQASLERGSESAVAGEKARQIIAPAEAERGLVAQAQRGLAGDTAAGKEWSKNRGDFLGWRAGVYADAYAGLERQPETEIGKLTQEYRTISPKQDEKTSEYDYDTFDAQRQAVLQRMRDAGYGADADELERTDSFIDADAAAFDAKYQDARAIRDDIPPEWKGVTPAFAQDLRDFSRQVTATREQASRSKRDGGLGFAPRMNSVARALARQMKEPRLGEWYTKTDAEKEKLADPAFDRWLVENRDTLETFYPDLYDVPWRKATGEIAEENPYDQPMRQERERRPEGERRPTRAEAYAEQQEEAEVRDILRWLASQPEEGVETPAPIRRPPLPGLRPLSTPTLEPPIPLYRRPEIAGIR